MIVGMDSTPTPQSLSSGGSFVFWIVLIAIVLALIAIASVLSMLWTKHYIEKKIKSDLYNTGYNLGQQLLYLAVHDCDDTKSYISYEGTEKHYADDFEDYKQHEKCSENGSSASLVSNSMPPSSCSSDATFFSYNLAVFLMRLCENVNISNCLANEPSERMTKASSSSDAASTELQPLKLPDGGSFDSSLVTEFRRDSTTDGTIDVTIINNSDSDSNTGSVPRIDRSIYAYMLHDRTTETTFLVWSGSSTTYMWIRDAEVITEPLPEYMNIYQYPNVYVHRGFLSIYEDLRDDIIAAWSNTYKRITRNLVICGHSLGGALASLSAFDLFGNNVIEYPSQQYHSSSSSSRSPTTLRSVHVYTFGSPKVGNIAYAEAFNEYVPTRVKCNTIRIFNTEDIVPYVPVMGPSFSMTYTHVGNNVAFSNNYGNIFDNHTKAYLQQPLLR